MYFVLVYQLCLILYCHHVHVTNLYFCDVVFYIYVVQALTTIFMCPLSISSVMSSLQMPCNDICSVFKLYVQLQMVINIG